MRGLGEGMVADYLLGGFACAIAFTLIGIAIGYLGKEGFVAVILAALALYLAYRNLPVQRWRWRLSRWWYRK